jgi:hypothetical protein
MHAVIYTMVYAEDSESALDATHKVVQILGTWTRLRAKPKLRSTHLESTSMGCTVRCSLLNRSVNQ